MSTSSNKKLTKFESSKTIVTGDFVNSIFGGLQGSYEGSLLEDDDPRIIGHVHDGEPYDGHSSKIDLVNHVEGKLLNQNLADEAVQKENVAKYATQNLAIPEYEVIDGDTKYYLNLAGVYSYIDDEIAAIPFVESSGVVKQRNTDYSSNTGPDFVFGSSSTEDLSSGTNGDNRFAFDKSKGTFMAGRVSDNSWNDSNRGSGSAIFGTDNKVSGNNSLSSGFGNLVLSPHSSAIGESNSITSGLESASALGKSNSVLGSYSRAKGLQAKTTVHGEESRASGAFSTVGDAQVVELVGRYQSGVAIFNITTGVLSLDGSGTQYVLEDDFAYTIEAHIVGKELNKQSAASIVLRYSAIGASPTASPPVASAAIFAGSKSIIYNSTPLSGVDADIALSGNSLRVRVSTSATSATALSRWVANIKIVRVKY